MNTLSILLEALIVVAVILLSLSIHEFAHAWVANLFGDPTARNEGRMTINPLKHWDSVGTTLLVGLIFVSSFAPGLGLPIFGWGKPVPIDERNFENPRWHGFQVAIAGPMSNLLLSLILAGIFRYTNPSDFWGSILVLAVSINTFLMFFNLMPIPPLDGSRILRLILPEEIYFAIVSNPIFSLVLIFVIIFFLLTPIANIAQSLSNYLLFR